jgi:pilus assembly protein Flp/PilA
VSAAAVSAAAAASFGASKASSMKTFFNRFLGDRRGATAVEYALLCALIAMAAIGGIGAVAGSIQTTFEAVANAQPAP